MAKNLTGMANEPPLMIKPAMPVSLSPALSRRKAPLSNFPPQAGERANEKGNIQSLRAREARIRYASSTLSDVLAALPPKRRAKVEQRAGELATRLAVAHTQQDLAQPAQFDHIAQEPVPAAKRRAASAKPRLLAR